MVYRGVTNTTPSLWEGVIETLNVTWMVAVLIFWLIPFYFYQRHYLKFLVLYSATLFVGLFFLEGFIEEEARIGDVFTWFAVEHEIPQLFYNTAAVAGLKIGIDYGYTLRQQRIIQLEKEKAQSEAMFLKSQLNPHVLFNNLNNIYSFALHQSAKTPEMILRLGDIMRYMLYEARHDFVPLDKELEYLNNYIELQRIQLEGRGDVRYEHSGVTKENSIAPMMLISVVENCFKHSAASKAQDLKILIKIKVVEQKLELFTENTFEKKNADDEDPLEEGGIGLENIRRRLELIYPSKHQLMVQEFDDIFIVNLTIDLS